MTDLAAKGFCTCKRDFPDRPELTPPDNASWHFLCDKPVLEYALDGPPTERPAAEQGAPVMCATCFGIDWTQPHECQGGSCFCFCRVPEYEPDDGEAQRIAEVYADARAEQDRGL